MRKTTQNGFTIVEILVAIGIMAISLFAFLSQMQSQTQSINFLQYQLNLANTRSSVHGQFFNANQQCQCFFQRNPTVIASAPSIITIPTPPPYNFGRYSNPNPGALCAGSTIPNPFLSTEGDMIHRLRLVNIQLNITNQLTTGPNPSYQGDFIFTVASTQKVAGPNPLPIRFNDIIFFTTGGTINNCSFNETMNLPSFVPAVQGTIEICRPGFCTAGGNSSAVLPPGRAPLTFAIPGSWSLCISTGFRVYRRQVDAFHDEMCRVVNSGGSSWSIQARGSNHSQSGSPALRSLHCYYSCFN